MEDNYMTNSKLVQNEISQKRKQQQLDKLQERLQESTTQKINLKKKLESKENEYEELIAECQSKFQLEQLQILRIMQLIEDEDKFRLSLNRNSQIGGGGGGESSPDMAVIQTNQQILDKEIETNDQQLNQLNKELFKLQDQLKDKTSQIETSQSLLDEIVVKKEHLKQMKVEKEQIKNEIQEFHETLENLKENINEINQQDNHKSISQKICDDNENKIELMENELESIVIKLKIKYQNIFNSTEQQPTEQQNINIEEVVQQKEKELSLEVEKMKKQITEKGEKELKNLEVMNKVKLETFQDEKTEKISAVQQKINKAQQQNSNLQGELIGIENLEQKIQDKYNQCKIMKEKWVKDQQQFKQLSEKSKMLEKQIVEIQKTINQLKQK